MHSPPRPVSVKDQQDWKIPPSISNWKNPKGYTIPLDKRLAADGRGLQETAINDSFAKFTEALYMAESSARQASKFAVPYMICMMVRKTHQIGCEGCIAHKSRFTSFRAVTDSYTGDCMCLFVTCGWCSQRQLHVCFKKDTIFFLSFDV